MSEKTIKVWDPLIRIFHWSLVILFFTAYFTGEEESNLHNYSGYAILGLLLFRIIWGFMGSKYARFSNFVYSPTTVISYLKELKAGSPSRYIGHNPAGGYMVVALLILLVITSLSGLKVLGLEGQGPLAGDISISLISTASADDDDNDEAHEQREHEGGEGKEYNENEEAEHFWEEIHEIAANLMLLLIFLHVAGVFISGKLHNENLVKAMLSGKKDAEE